MISVYEGACVAEIDVRCKHSFSTPLLMTNFRGRPLGTARITVS